MSAVLWPNGLTTPGEVWHEYGPRAPIWTPNGPTSSFHSGIDIGPWSDTLETWLLSPVDGEVTHAAYDDIFGNRVVVSTELDGDDVAFWLCHGRTGSMRVKRGDIVAQKQQLQLMGETGKASGRHLHFEVHVNGERVNPREFYARPHTGAGSTSKEIQMDCMILINGKIYALAPGFLKHCDSTVQVEEAKSRGVRQYDYTGKGALDQWVRALDFYGVPRDAVNGNGHVLNPQSGKFEDGGLWTWSRAVLAKLK